MQHQDRRIDRRKSCGVRALLLQPQHVLPGFLASARVARPLSTMMDPYEAAGFAASRPNMTLQIGAETIDGTSTVQPAMKGASLRMARRELMEGFG
jgi:hypothetical protein